MPTHCQHYTSSCWHGLLPPPLRALLCSSTPAPACLPAAGALEEVDWLRAKLESLETALLAGSLDSGLLAALDGGGTGADVLEAARAAVLGSGGGGADLQPDAAVGTQPGTLEPLAAAFDAAAAAAAAAAAGGEAAASAGLGAALLLGGLQLVHATGQAGDSPAEQVHAAAPQEPLQAQKHEQRVAAKAPLIDPHLITSELEEAATGCTTIGAVWPTRDSGSAGEGGNAAAACSAAGQDTGAAAGLSESALPAISRPPTAKGALVM